MTKTAEEMKARIEELEAGLKEIHFQINNIPWYTNSQIKTDIGKLLNPSTNGKP